MKIINGIKIHAKHDRLIPIESFIPHDLNTNEHPKEQIELLAKIIKFQGVRHSIIISNLSGKCVAGHGRYEAFKLNGMTEIPVVYQDFDNIHQEYAFLESDNHIAELAEHNVEKMKKNIKDLDIKLDLDLLGIPDLNLEDVEDEEKKEYTDNPEIPYSGELGKKDDYLVIRFEDSDQFNKACEKLNVQRVKYDLSTTGHLAFRHTGVGRIINGEEILDRL